MKILITSNLVKSTLEAKIMPIASLKKISEIYFVSDNVGPKLPKVRYHSPPSFLTKFSLIKAISKFVLLVYLTVRENPEVIMGIFTVPHGINAFLCAKMFRKPVIISVMGGSREIIKAMAFNKNEKYLGGKLEKALLSMLGRSDVIICTGLQTKDFLVKHGISSGKIHIIPSSIESKRFHPKALPKRYDVIFVGRLVKVKRVDVLLTAISKVKGVHKNIKVAIVGDGPLRGHLEKMAKEMFLNDNVEFLGWREDTEYYLNSSKVFILTSEGEGLPLAMVEAMACGIPVIVPRVGDISTIAKNEINSLVLEPLNSDAFAYAIMQLLDNKELYERLSKKAVESIKEYTTENAIKKWEEILNLQVWRG